MENGLTYEGLMNTVYSLLATILQMADLAAVAAIVWFGVRMALSRGDPAKFNEAKKGLIYACIGAVIIFGVYTILATVRGAVGSIGGQ